MPNFNLCSFLKPFHHRQFNIHDNDDFILIYDGNSIIISRLSGLDIGPKSKISHSYWERKIISSSSNKMIVEFRANEVIEYTGFSASIEFIQLQSQICKSWLDIDNKTLISPNYPNTYDNNESCHWLITVRHRFHIQLKFHEFNVSV